MVANYAMLSISLGWLRQSQADEISYMSGLRWLSRKEAFLEGEHSAPKRDTPE